jgi:plastocyanin
LKRVLAVALSLAVLLGAAQPVQAAFVVKSVYDSSAPYDYRFVPKTANVAAGTRVTWKSMSGVHNIVSISRNWSKDSVFSPGSPTSYTFNRSGTYRYRCSYHSSYNSTTKVCTGQCGRIVVG